MPTLDNSRAERAAGRADHQPAEAVFVPAPCELASPSGDHAIRTLARAPRRLGMLARSRVTGRALPPSRIGKSDHSTGQPSASLTNASRVRRARTAADPPIAVTAGHDRTRPVARRARMMRDPSHGMSGRSHSCHTSARAVGRPLRVPGVVGVRTRCGHADPSSGTIDDVARVVALDRERHLTRARHGGGERATVASERPLDAPSAPITAGRRPRPRRQLVVVDPAPAAADARTRQSRSTGGPDLSRAGDHEVGPAVVSCRSRPAGCRTATTGDRRPHAERATIAAVITGASR